MALPSADGEYPRVFSLGGLRVLGGGKSSGHWILEGATWGSLALPGRFEFLGFLKAPAVAWTEEFLEVRPGSPSRFPILLPFGAISGFFRTGLGGKWEFQSRTGDLGWAWPGLYILGHFSFLERTLNLSPPCALVHFSFGFRYRSRDHAHLGCRGRSLGSREGGETTWPGWVRFSSLYRDP